MKTHCRLERSALMCGISGYWLDPKFKESVKPNLKDSLACLIHRGPDHVDENYFNDMYGQVGLGHTRLSILDLTDGGNQPMHTLDGECTIIFNGEIYNYLELKRELINLGVNFVGNSDTEVLLNSWKTWGIECLPKLAGMFAFVVYDRSNNTLTLARDPFGIKPLFYSSSKWGLCFASEMKSLLILRGEQVMLNLQRSYDYLVHGDYDSNEQTFIEGVNQLAPGCVQVFDLVTGALHQPIRWWNPSLAQTSNLSFKQASEKLREIFLSSVGLHLRSDVPLGAALSGGIDSSAVVCAMRHIEPKLPINTFSYIAKNSSLSEECWVDMVNDHVKAKVHKVEVEPSELLSDLDDMIIAQGEPFGSTSIYAQYRVFQLAKKNGVTVTLDGQGADEILVGYNGYPGKRVRSLLAEGNIFGAIRFLASWAQWPGRSLGYGLKLAGAEYLKGNLYQTARKMVSSSEPQDWIKSNFLTDRGVQLVYPVQGTKADPKNRVLIEALIEASTRKGLPALLRHADRNSMKFSVESRVPFLTSEMANFLFSLPEEYLISEHGETKFLFRSAMRGIVPDEILDRRDKIGFATPEYELLKGAYRSEVRWISKVEGLDFLHHEVIQNKINQVLLGDKPYSSQIWRWINFYKWHELVFQPLKVILEKVK